MSFPMPRPSPALRMSRQANGIAVLSLRRWSWVSLAQHLVSLQAIQAVNEHEVMTGSGGRFDPKQMLVREQAAAILVRLQKLIPETFN